MKYYFKTYDISYLDFEAITENVKERLEKVNKFQFNERLENTNNLLWDKYCSFWLFWEEIVKQLDNEVILSKNINDKYDYTKWEKFIDLKTMKTNKSLEEIIKYKYKTWLMASQVKLAQKFCDENEIDYNNYCFEILYWDWVSEQVTRAFNENLRLSNILKQETIFWIPHGTYWTSIKQEEYVIKMSSDNSEENIFL